MDAVVDCSSPELSTSQGPGPRGEETWIGFPCQSRARHRQCGWTTNGMWAHWWNYLPRSSRSLSRSRRLSRGLGAVARHDGDHAVGSTRRRSCPVRRWLSIMLSSDDLYSSKSVQPTYGWSPNISPVKRAINKYILTVNRYVCYDLRLRSYTLRELNLSLGFSMISMIYARIRLANEAKS